MKKIFTLTLALFILSSAAFSQSFFTRVSFTTPVFSINFGHRYVETYSFTQYERDKQITNINANYNQQVKEIMNLRIGAAKKVDLIQQLQREKANKVQNVNNRFFDEKNKYNYMHYDRNYRWIR
ncbi:MAG TPA: hypothetical protein VEV62_13775 [Parafilimonas sp.]|nr:hypothetical protein [Parafilimonas sp.]